MKKIYVVGYQTGYARWVDAVRVNNIEEADIVMFTGGEDVDPHLYNCEVHYSTYYTRSRDKEEVAAYEAMREDQLALGICRGLQLLTVLNGGLLVQDVKHHGIWGTHKMINKEGEVYEITSLHHQMAYPWNLNPEHYDILFDTPHRSYKDLAVSGEVQMAYEDRDFDFICTDYDMNGSIRDLLNSGELVIDKDFDRIQYRALHYEGDKIDLNVIRQHNDPEVIYFHQPGHPRALGIQGHPEMMDKNDATVIMFNNLLNELCHKKD